MTLVPKHVFLAIYLHRLFATWGVFIIYVRIGQEDLNLAAEIYVPLLLMEPKLLTPCLFTRSLLSMLAIQVSAMIGDPDRSPLMNNDHPFDNFPIDNNSWLFEFLSQYM